MAMPKKAPSMPKPFSRPSVSIAGDTPALPKTWQHLTADKVSVGDLVADLGTIGSVHVHEDKSTILMNTNKDTMYVRAGDTVFAFTTHAGG